MALLNKPVLNSPETWKAFFLNTLNFPDDEATTYATSFHNEGASVLTLYGLLAKPDPSAAISGYGITKRGHADALLGYISSAASTSRTVSKPRRLPPPCPVLSQNMTLQSFLKFKFDWNTYKTQCAIPGPQLSHELYHCCQPNDGLQSSIITEYPKFLELSKTDAIAALEHLVLRKSNPLVHRLKFLTCNQQQDE